MNITNIIPCKKLKMTLPPIHHFIFQSSLFKKLNKEFLKRRINNLPDDLKRYIFDYLKLELIYNDFLQKIQSPPCKCLDYLIIRPILPYIFAFPNLTQLCIENIIHFKDVFTMFKKYSKKNYISLKKGDDFALSLLCYLYK